MEVLKNLAVVAPVELTLIRQRYGSKFPHITLHFNQISTESCARLACDICKPVAIETIQRRANITDFLTAVDEAVNRHRHDEAERQAESYVELAAR